MEVYAKRTKEYEERFVKHCTERIESNIIYDLKNGTNSSNAPIDFHCGIAIIPEFATRSYNKFSVSSHNYTPCNIYNSVQQKVQERVNATKIPIQITIWEKDKEKGMEIDWKARNHYCNARDMEWKRI